MEYLVLNNKVECPVVGIGTYLLMMIGIIWIRRHWNLWSAWIFSH